MAGITWHKNPSVADALQTEAFSFDFDQAILVLERLQALQKGEQVYEKYALGQAAHVSLEAVTLKSHVTFAMQASPLQKLDVTADKPLLWMNFLSIAGVQGPLPTPYTEMLLERLREKDTSFRDFLDIFNHRLASLWYRFHKVIRPAVGLQQPEESTIGKCLLNLAGANSANVSTKALLSYQTLFWQQSRSLYGLQRLLAHHFKMPIKIYGHQGVFRIARSEDVSRIGTAKGQWNVLGQSAILGNKMWDQSASIRIDAGPLDHDTFDQLLPKSTLYTELQNLCRSYVPTHTTVQLRLIIQENQIRPTRLQAGATANKNRLGLNTWIGTGNSQNTQAFERLVPISDTYVRVNLV